MSRELRIPFADNAKPAILAAIEPVVRTVTLPEQREYFIGIAEQVDDLLFTTLPGGLYDHIAARMWQRKASIFVVTHQPAPKLTRDDINAFVALLGSARSATHASDLAIAEVAKMLRVIVEKTV